MLTIIPHLVNHLIREYQNESAKALCFKISPTVWELLADYDWPGNLHELRGVVWNALIHLRGSVLGPGDMLRAGILTVPQPLKRMAAGAREKPETTPVANPLDVWFNGLTEQAAGRGRIDYDDFKRYAVIRALRDVAGAAVKLKWTEVGGRVGLAGNRAREVLRAIALNAELNADAPSLGGKAEQNQYVKALMTAIEAGKANALRFVDSALRYYTDRLSGPFLCLPPNLGGDVTK